MLYPKRPPKLLLHPRCMHCNGKGWLSRHQSLRKKTCEFCGGGSFKVHRKAWASTNWSPLMALYLRRGSDEFPRTHWAPATMSGENVVGSLQKLNSGSSGERSRWSITAIVETATGWVETREAAAQARRLAGLAKTDRSARDPLG